MKKLDDIPKKNIFEVPEKYFDEMALNIQAKTEKLSKRETFSAWSFTFRYALPVVVLLIGSVYVLKPKEVEQDTEAILSSIPSEHLVDFLHESNATEAELLEAINLNENDADSLNRHFHFNKMQDGFDMDEFEEILESEL